MGNIHIASGPNEEATTVPQLIAADTPAMVTKDVLIDSTQGALAQYVPLKFDPVDGFYKAWAPGDAIAAITAYAIPDAAVDQRAALYFAGCFNIDAIAWPASTSEEQVLLACHASTANSLLHFRKLLYSDKRVLASGLRVGVVAPPEVAD